jgi:hypothetical protein
MITEKCRRKIFLAMFSSSVEEHILSLNAGERDE